MYDGGSKLVGYIIDKREMPYGRWLKANYGNVSETNFKVEGLVEKKEYEFRVFAKNTIGKFSSKICKTLLVYLFRIKILLSKAH